MVKVHSMSIDVNEAEAGAGAWSEHLTENGRSYYHHPQHGTTWKRPRQLGAQSPANMAKRAFKAASFNRGRGDGGGEGGGGGGISQSVSSLYKGRGEGGGGSGGRGGGAEDILLPTEEYGTFFQHVITCRCDGFDWLVCCSLILVLIGVAMLVAGLVDTGGLSKGNGFGDTATSSGAMIFCIGLGLAGIPCALWCLIVGLPFIAYNSTLGRSRS